MDRLQNTAGDLPFRRARRAARRLANSADPEEETKPRRAREQPDKQGELPELRNKAWRSIRLRVGRRLFTADTIQTRKTAWWSPNNRCAPQFRTGPPSF